MHISNFIWYWVHFIISDIVQCLKHYIYTVPILYYFCTFNSSLIILWLTNEFTQLTNLKFNLFRWVWLNGRASVCGTEGCRFKSYYPPLGSNNTIFKKNKIQKKNFKKKVFLIKIFNIKNNINCFFYSLTLKYIKLLKDSLILYGVGNSNKSIKKSNLYIICISQKKYNMKCVFKKNFDTVNTFSVGSVMKYFKIKQGKYIRRSIKGSKIFLNFLKNIFEKKYSTKNITGVFLNILGVDYNLINLKKNLKKFLKSNNHQNSLIYYTLNNIKVSFTKTKNKKVKAIKKRLKKKIALNFLKKNSF